MSSVIALAGTMGVGKDTIADELVRTHGYRQTGFAKALKELARHLFGYSLDTLWGASHLRNVPDLRAALDEYWEDVLDCVYYDDQAHAMIRRLFPWTPSIDPLIRLETLIENDFKPHRATLTPRHVLQQLGTEWGRALDPDVWLHAVKTEINRAPVDTKWVITDCRFANEAQFVVEAFKGSPVWVDASKRLPVSGGSGHASEPTLQDLEPWCATVLDNNGDLDQVPERVRALLVQLVP